MQSEEKLMKRIVNATQKAASYCCESSNTVDVNRVEKKLSKHVLSEENKAASYCCESSNVVDITKIEEVND